MPGQPLAGKLAASENHSRKPAADGKLAIGGNHSGPCGGFRGVVPPG